MIFFKRVGVVLKRTVDFNTTFAISISDRRYLCTNAICSPIVYLLFLLFSFQKIPPKKGVIRGHSYLTGYMIRPKGANSCDITYVTRSDPKGKDGYSEGSHSKLSICFFSKLWVGGSKEISNRNSVSIKIRK